MPALRLALEHPVAVAALLLFALAFAARAYFRYTRRFLERFDELPDRGVLSGTEQLILGFPRALDAERLARLDARYRIAARVAFALALVATLPLGFRAAVRAGEPRAERRERVDTLLRELELELAERALGEARPARVEELSARLEALLPQLAPEGQALAPDAADLELARRTRALLAVARGEHEAVLDLVSERELELEAARTEAQIAREVELAVLRARAERGLGRPHRALEHFERALRLRPERAELCLEAAETIFELGRPTDALALLERGVALDARAVAEGRAELAPRLARARELRADALHEAGLAAEALAELDALVPLLRELLARDGDASWREELAAALHGQGTLLEELGRTDEALAAYDRAVSARRALSLEALERDVLARELELAEALTDRARTLAQRDEGERALRDLDEVVELRERACAHRDELELQAALALSRAARGALRADLGARGPALEDLDAAVATLERLGPELAPVEALARARAALEASRAQPAALALAPAEGPVPGVADAPAASESIRPPAPLTDGAPWPPAEPALEPEPEAPEPARARPAARPENELPEDEPPPAAESAPSKTIAARISAPPPELAPERAFEAPREDLDERALRGLARVEEHLERAAARLAREAPEAALADADAAGARLRELSVGDAERAALRARVELARAEALAALDRAEDARAALDALFEALPEAASGAPGCARLLAAGHELRARLAVRARRFEQAEPDYDAAVALRRRLVEAELDEAEPALARALTERGMVVFNRHDPSRALRDLEEAVQLLALLVDHEGRGDLRPLYDQACASRALVAGR